MFKLIDTDKLTAIANAIRSKNGTENTYAVDDMPTAIEAISGGGGGSWNIYAQEEEPEADGLWIKTPVDSVQIEELVFEDGTRINAEATLENGTCEFAMTSVGSICYIFGGRTASTFLNIIQAYDTITGIRSTLPTTLGDTLYRASAASIGSICYIFGGRPNDSTNTGSTSIQAYDTTTGILTTINNLPVGLYSMSTVSIGGLCYVFGGTAPGAVYVYTIYIYDSTTNILSLSSRALATNTSSNHSSAAVGAVAYIFGGRRSSTLSTVVQAYDTSTEIRTIKTAQIAATTSVFSSAASVGNICYIFGGGNNGGSYSNIIQAYDTTTDMITTIEATLSSARGETVSTSIAGICYIFGGVGGSGTTYYNTIQMFKVSTHQFEDNTAVIVTGESGNYKVTLTDTPIKYTPRIKKVLLQTENGLIVTNAAIKSGETITDII